MSNYPYSNFDTGGETDILNVTGIDNNILVKDGNGAITSTFLTNNEVRGSIDFTDGINIVGVAHGTGLQVENNSVRIGKGNVASGTSSISRTALHPGIVPKLSARSHLMKSYSVV